MASAKKGKKNKGKTLALVDFLQETPGAVPSVPLRKSNVNWADEVEDNHDVYDARSAKASVILPTAPKASRDFDDIIDKVPQDPPFIAYLTNLPYDVDEEEISYFFRNMKIANMRIPKDDRTSEMPKLKGYGYVEFEDRDSLLNALVIPDTTIKNRRIRIEIATDYDNDKRRSGRMDMNRDRGGRGEASTGDWRSGPRQESTGDADRRGFSRDRDRERDADSSSMWRDGDRRPPRDRESDRGGFTRSDRFREERDDKFMSRSRNGGGGGGGFNRNPSSREEGFSRNAPRDEGFSRNAPRDEGFSRNAPRDEGFSRNAPREEGFSRSSAREEGFSRNPPRDEDSSEPRRRTKLVLTPRTKPVENESEKPSASASIFGNAKPVDTSARERQIEERLAKDNDAPARRDVSKERREVDRESVGHKERRDNNVSDSEKKSVEREKPASDVNGVVERSQNQKKSSGDQVEKKEATVKPAEGDKPKSEVKKKEEKKEKAEKEMPKLKKTEPPNFIASNKFAYLETEDSSD